MTAVAWAAALVMAALLSGAAPAGAQDVCACDCNEDGTVLINELVTCVNISLGNSPLSICPAGDPNDNGAVQINELIQGVNAANGQPCGGDGGCGDGVEQAGEECDDGNNFGGDGCAGNCTDEFSVVGVFDPARSIATVQTEGFPVIINLTGQQTFRFGTPRDTETRDASGDVIYQANEMPAAVKVSELLFDPVRITGLVCACVRGVATPSFGPGNAATGSIACADGILSDISYRLVQDHNTTPPPAPESAGNRLSIETGTPDDPECDDVTTLPGGTTSEACKEGFGADCMNDPGMEEEHPHIGVCNGPRQLTRSGGAAPNGSAFILFNNAIGLLQDRGLCADNPRLPNGQCEFADYGPDCQPCTSDDLEMGTEENVPLTTGMAEAVVVDANNSESVENIPGASVQIEKDADCLGPCKTVVTGSLFNCDNILSGRLAGGSLGVAFPSIDAATIGDNVTTATFVNQ